MPPPHMLRDTYNLLTRRDILYAFDRAADQFPKRPNRSVRILREYRNHPDFRIIATDKNLGLAVISTSAYKEMVHQHLDNASIYALQRDGSAKSIVDLHLPRLRHLIKAGKDAFSYIRGIDRFLDDAEQRNVIPKFHCIAKVHKTPIVGRPIAGAVNWITTSVSALLSHELRKFTKDMPWVLKDSRQLIQQLENVPIDRDEIFVSFDIVALYPSMDQQATIEAVRSLPFPEDYPATKRDWLIAATAFILETSYVEFQGEIYKQVDGMAMGTNAACELANIYVSHVIEKHWVVTNWLNSHHVRHWKRYLDDIFCIVRGHRIAKQMLTMLNALDPTGKLQFTLVTHPDTLPVLDVEAYRDNGRVAFRIYQKALNKYLYIPFHSEHPPHTKRGFIKGELLRYVRNSSKYEDFSRVRRLFFVRLRARGYPERFLSHAFATVRYEQRFGLLHLPPITITGEGNIICSVTYHPIFRVIGLAGLLRRHWSLLSLPAYFQPTIAYRRNASVADLATRSSA